MASDEILNLDDSTLEESVTQESPMIDEMRQENPDGSITLKLKYPTQVQYRTADGKERDERIEELNIRRANGGDLRQVIRFQKDEEKVVTLLFVRLTNLPTPVFDRLDAIDLMRFYEEIQDFLPQSPPTGKKS